MNLNVQVVTKERVKRMAKDTFRGPGDLIDFLVDEAYKRMYPAGDAPVTVSVETVKEG
jgi:hypothetical protein